ncbi:hypothetical protein MMC11_002580 [Xylographa trunciseda]|nr:hypothetical protein [Xylographa trunciseda]
MSLVPRNVVDKCILSVKKLRTTLNNAQHITLPDQLLLRDNARRLVELLASLEVQMQQKHVPTAGNYNTPTKDAGNVVATLTSGIDETVYSLAETLGSEDHLRLTESIEQLNAKLALHSKSIALLLEYFDRYGARCRSRPNAYLERRRKGTKRIDQRAQLGARLKNVFNCPLPALARNALIVTADALQSVPSLSPSRRKDILATSSPLLALLQLGAEVYLPGFPHDTCVEEVIPVAVNLLAGLEKLPEKSAAFSHDKSKSAALFVDFYKCAWVVRSLDARSLIGTSHAGLEVIIELMLDEVMHGFQNSFTNALQPPDLELLPWHCYTVKNPLQTLAGVRYDQDLSKKPESSLDFSNSAYEYTESSTIAVEASQLTCWTGLGQFSPKQVATMPYEEALDEMNTLRTAYIIAEKPLDQHEFLRSSIRVFQDVSKQNGGFRILVCQGESLLIELQIDPLLAEIVPGYAFGNPLVLWFRQNNKDLSLCFSATGNDIASLIDLQNMFVGDECCHFPTIQSICLCSKKSSQCKIFLKATAQMWLVAPGEGIRRFDQSLRSLHRPRTNSSESSTPIQLPEHVDAIGGYVEVARIVLFCDFSIYFVLVTDELMVTFEPPDSLILSVKSGKSHPLTIYITEGSRDHPAALAIDPKEGQHTTKSKEYCSIRFSIPQEHGENSLRVSEILKHVYCKNLHGCGINESYDEIPSSSHGLSLPADSTVGT